MDQENFGLFIRDIRKKHNLTQQQLASILGVTYQAVSKWERGLNMPDTIIIRQIAKEFNISIDDIFTGNYDKKKKSNKNIIITIILLVSILTIIITIIITRKESNFEFKTISTSCDNFTISGSLSYNKNKSAIYISKIEYCGIENKEKYNKIECLLYEQDNNITKQISSYYKENTDLESFLKELTFTIDNYSQVCREYSENSLYLLINATDNLGIVTSYKIPLTLENNCKNIK